MLRMEQEKLREIKNTPVKPQMALNLTPDMMMKREHSYSKFLMEQKPIYSLAV